VREGANVALPILTLVCVVYMRGKFI
jgi:hypothetical protein